MPKPPNVSPGRPKGSKGKPPTGLPLNKRLKVLQKIILDDTQKSADRLTAIKLMTELLSDKIQTSADGKQEMVLSFNEYKGKNVETKPLIPENKEKIIIENIENKKIEPEIPKKVEVSNTTSCSFTFQIDKDLPNDS